MEYYNWQTMFDEHRWIYGSDKKHTRNLTDEDIFRVEIGNILTTPFKDETNRIKRLTRLVLERVWIRHGRPYYNVHPQMVRSLCKTNLEKIPVEFIEVPANLEAVCFRFAENVPTTYVNNSGFDVSYFNSDHFKACPIYARSVLFTKLAAKDTDRELLLDTVGKMRRSGVLKNSLEKITEEFSGLDSDSLVLFIDEGFRLKQQNVERLMCNLVHIRGLPGETVAQAIQNAVASVPEKEKILYESMGDRLPNLLRVLVSSGFMANSPEDGLVIPDVLSADRAAYAQAVRRGDQNSAKTIVERAQRRGKIGYNVGTNEMFAGESEYNPADSHDDSTGRELGFSHIRGGHPHAVRYGEGKSKIKIKWFRPTRVRPDLPFKTEDKK